MSHLNSHLPSFADPAIDDESTDHDRDSDDDLSLDNRPRRAPWTDEEDKRLQQFVAEHNGISDPRNVKWSLAASSLPGRRAKQCRERWMNLFSPAASKLPWTDDEDRKIIALHKVYNTKWTAFARELPGRSENTIKNRWNSTLRRVTRYEMQIRKHGVSAVKRATEEQVLFRYCRLIKQGSEEGGFALDDDGYTLVTDGSLSSAPALGARKRKSSSSSVPTPSQMSVSLSSPSAAPLSSRYSPGSSISNFLPPDPSESYGPSLPSQPLQGMHFIVPSSSSSMPSNSSSSSSTVNTSNSNTMFAGAGFGGALPSRPTSVTPLNNQYYHTHHVHTHHANVLAQAHAHAHTLQHLQQQQQHQQQHQHGAHLHGIGQGHPGQPATPGGGMMPLGPPHPMASNGMPFTPAPSHPQSVLSAAGTLGGPIGGGFAAAISNGSRVLQPTAGPLSSQPLAFGTPGGSVVGAGAQQPGVVVSAGGMSSSRPGSTGGVALLSSPGSTSSVSSSVPPHAQSHLEAARVLSNRPQQPSSSSLSSPPQTTATNGSEFSLAQQQQQQQRGQQQGTNSATGSGTSTGMNITASASSSSSPPVQGAGLGANAGGAGVGRDVPRAFASIIGSTLGSYNAAAHTASASGFTSAATLPSAVGAVSSLTDPSGAVTVQFPPPGYAPTSPSPKLHSRSANFPLNALDSSSIISRPPSSAAGASTIVAAAGMMIGMGGRSSPLLPMPIRPPSAALPAVSTSSTFASSASSSSQAQRQRVQSLVPPGAASSTAALGAAHVQAQMSQTRNQAFNNGLTATDPRPRASDPTPAAHRRHGASGPPAMGTPAFAMSNITLPTPSLAKHIAATAAMGYAPASSKVGQRGPAAPVGGTGALFASPAPLLRGAAGPEPSPPSATAGDTGYHAGHSSVVGGGSYSTPMHARRRSAMQHSAWAPVAAATSAAAAAAAAAVETAATRRKSAGAASKRAQASAPAVPVAAAGSPLMTPPAAVPSSAVVTAAATPATAQPAAAAAGAGDDDTFSPCSLEMAFSEAANEESSAPLSVPSRGSSDSAMDAVRSENTPAVKRARRASSSSAGAKPAGTRNSEHSPIALAPPPGFQGGSGTAFTPATVGRKRQR